MTHPMSTQPIAPSRKECTAQIEGIPRRFVAEQPPGEAVEPEHAWYFPCKAAVDFLIALVLLVLTAPLLLLAAVLVKLTSRGPAFYCQTRLGKDRREFTLYKLRTMVKNAENMTGPIWADADDPRITALGRFLRGAHIDELPQLANVLLGQMSLVGPRPERPELVPNLEEQLPRYRDRLKVRPGMTGFAQLRLPPDSNLESVRQKLPYDLYYVRFAGPWLDLRILLLTSIRLLVDASKTAWQLVALPRWETVKQRVPAVTNADADWRAPENPDHDTASRDELLTPDSHLHAALRKAR
jgi:lipopolysaccharide/colanic/teichoic acid biosynthesis glycosyltransferase